MVDHEFGHFALLRSLDLVREFAIGMGPKIFTSGKDGTAYTIRLLLLNWLRSYGRLG